MDGAIPPLTDDALRRRLVFVHNEDRLGEISVEYNELRGVVVTESEIDDSSVVSDTPTTQLTKAIRLPDPMTSYRMTPQWYVIVFVYRRSPWSCVTRRVASLEKQKQLSSPKTSEEIGPITASRLLPLSCVRERACRDAVEVMLRPDGASPRVVRLRVSLVESRVMLDEMEADERAER